MIPSSSPPPLTGDQGSPPSQDDLSTSFQSKFGGRTPTISFPSDISSGSDTLPGYGANFSSRRNSYTPSPLGQYIHISSPPHPVPSLTRQHQKPDQLQSGPRPIRRHPAGITTTPRKTTITTSTTPLPSTTTPFAFLSLLFIANLACIVIDSVQAARHVKNGKPEGIASVIACIIGAWGGWGTVIHWRKEILGPGGGTVVDRRCVGMVIALAVVVLTSGVFGLLRIVSGKAGGVRVGL